MTEAPRQSSPAVNLTAVPGGGCSLLQGKSDDLPSGHHPGYGSTPGPGSVAILKTGVDNAPENDRTSDKRWPSECPACPKWTSACSTRRMIGQLLGCGIPHCLVSSMPDHVFLRRRFSSESGSFSAHRMPLTSPAVAWRRWCRRRAASCRASQKVLFRPAADTAPRAMPDRGGTLVTKTGYFLAVHGPKTRSDLLQPIRVGERGWVSIGVEH